MNPPPGTIELEAVLGNRDFLRSLARGLVGDEQRAEDLVQDACVRALERPPQSVGALRIWLTRVVRNLAHNERLREAQRPAVERRAALPERGRTGEERDLELEGEVIGAVRALRQPYRSAIYLRYYLGLGPRQIAGELGVAEATVKTRLRRGLELLRAELDRRHGGDRRSWCAALVTCARPELFSPAGAVPPAAVVKAPAAVVKGTLLMNKPLTAALGAAALVAAFSVAFFELRGTDETPARPAEKAALAPETGAPLAADAAPAAGAQQAVPTPEEEARASAGGDVPGASERAAAPTHGLVGRAVDEGGRPVAGAAVRALRLDTDGLGFSLGAGPPTHEVATTTAGDGRFHLGVGEDGPVHLIVEAAGFAPFRKEVTGYHDLRTEVGDLALSAGVFLAGRVIDAAGHPVAGAEISTSPTVQSQNVIFSLAGDDEVIAVSDAGGRFRVDRHAVGPWTLVARAADHPEGRADGETTRAGERVDDVEIVLPAGASITGRIGALPDGAGPLWVRAAPVVEETAGGGNQMIAFIGDPETVFAERVAAVRPDGTFALSGLAEDQRYRLRAYDTEAPFGGRARSRLVEEQAGVAGVELLFSTGASISVRAVDAQSGAPVEEFVLSAGLELPQPLVRAGEVVRHHPGGAARVDDLRVRAGSERVTASVSILAEGYAPWERRDVSLPRDGAVDLGLVKLLRVPRVHVTVLDSAGLPVEGATVGIVPAPEGQAGGGREVRRALRLRPGGADVQGTGVAEREGTTDAAGEVALTALPGQRVRLAVEARRFASWRSEPLELPSGTDLSRTVRMARGATVEVLVVDAAGEPVPGARVEHRLPPDESDADALARALLGATARVSDSEGRVYFRNLTPELHQFRLEDESGGSFTLDGPGGMAARVAAVRMGGSETPWTELELAEDASEMLTLVSGSQSSLAGTVTEDGRALAGAELRLVADADDPLAMMGDDGPRATTDAEGAYAFEELEPGEYELVVRHATRAMPHRQAVEVRAGRDRLDLDLDVTLVSGRVTDAEGRPLAGARVSAERAPASDGGGGQRRMVMIGVRATPDSGGGGDVFMSFGGQEAKPVETDEDGRYVLRGVPAGLRVRVKAEAEECSPTESEPFELEPDEDRAGVDLELAPGGALAVEVRDADGAPAGRVVLTLRRLEDGEPSGAPEVALSDEQGRHVFADLEPGLWSVTAQRIGEMPAGEPARRDVEVVAGEETPLAIEL